MDTERKLLIGIVGPCASGKSTLVKRLIDRGIISRHIAQEHSYVPSMWKKITNPDVLIYLKVSYPLTIQRNQLNWTVHEYNEQIFRLRHAYENADLVIETDNLTPDEVEAKALDYIEKQNPVHL